ncbi:hypothetical protein Ddye_012399 [Dipteronia dyeriana]|uniref:Kinesin light chain n=1 Tax=Dipteronia dyeriana TaxID=168575 RepID=A0AAE0CJ77_9ROSI|nr:hypothetical protein Ddye_012399 [Dipteronia dyeriana]
MMTSMYLRQVAGNLRRITGVPSRIVSSSAPLLPLSRKTNFFYPHGCGGYKWRKKDSHQWIFMFGPTAILFGINPNLVLAEDDSIQSSSENDKDEANIVGLRKSEDGSVISNIHTSKWRVFTDNGRDFFMKGKLEQAEKFFLSALQEAKEGFGERDPHVASACNNLAELYRVQKAFDKAEPLYLEAVDILEDSFGPEDIRMGVAFHNLGQFYLVQRRLKDAHIYYERALKIKGCVLGHNNVDYADTMYHLGTVLYLLGNVQDSEALFHDSIRILEEGGQGESMTCIRRLRYLSQVYLKANRLEEAENIQRKILHVMELLKGWNSLDTVIAAEGLSLTLQSIRRLREAQELLERCLDARKTLLPEDHIQIGANMLRIAKVAMVTFRQPRKTHISEAITELDRAKELLDKSTRIARQVLNKLTKQKGNKKNYGASGETTRDRCAALVILLQSLDTLGLLEITRQELIESREENVPNPQAESALFECISAYKEFGTEKSVSDSPEVKAEYVSCSTHLLSLIDNDNSTGRTQPSKEITLQELKEEIKRINDEISSSRRSKH